MEAKVVLNEDEAWNRQELYDDIPHGWIQWKGTDVCVDIHCKCGTLSHFDGEFMYSIQCPECKTIYFCNGHIELIEMTEPTTSPDLIKVASD